MANTMMNEKLLMDLLKQQVEVEVENAYQEAIEVAMKAANDKIKEKLAQISTKILNYYSIEKDGLNVVITVRNDLVQ